MLNTSRKILEDTYLYLVSDRISGKKAKLQGDRVCCLKCGRSDKTLRKIANGKICVDCLKEQQNER